jgi:hypothetical protein
MFNTTPSSTITIDVNCRNSCNNYLFSSSIHFLTQKCRPPTHPTTHLLICVIITRQRWLSNPPGPGQYFTLYKDCIQYVINELISRWIIQQPCWHQ